MAKEFKRTPAQDAAVTSRGRSLMISAAAGSGKTATLTQRIIALLTEKEAPADISGMLVVTFTVKAAGELRERITAALNEALAADPGNRHLQKQLTSVGAAPICTIDSYYLSLVRENFQRLGLPSSFRMADPAESSTLALDVARKLIEYKYENDPFFPHFADTLTTARSEESLPSQIIALANHAQSLPGGTGGLKKSAELFRGEAEGEFFDSRCGRLARKELTETVRNAGNSLVYDIGLASSADECENYLPALQSDLDFISELSAALAEGSYEEVRNLVLSYSPANMGRAKGKATDTSKAVLADRNAVKDLLLKDLPTGLLSKTKEALCREFLESAALCDCAASVCSDFLAAFADAKNSRMIADFSDLGLYTLRLLENPDGTPSDIALSERAKFSHIFIDEYQDTSAAQDRIFRLISGDDNLFIVGDVKQSIYSFRGARPGVFSAYRNIWTAGAKEEGYAPASVYMSENFRCSKAVIDFTNTVCGRLFTAAAESAAGDPIPYRKEDELIYAGKSPSVSPVEVFLCAGLPKAGDGEDELPKALTDGSEAELDLIVSKIREIASRRGCPERNEYAWQDIAVLSRSAKNLAALSSRLTKEGIPFCNNAGSSLFDNPEVELFYSLLCAIDNPLRDLPLTGALRSPLFGFGADDLTRLRMGNRTESLWEVICAYPDTDEADPELAGLCRNTKERLLSLRRLSEELPVDRFIRLLWHETEAQAYSGSDPDTALQLPRERQSNLRRFYDFARTYKSSGFRTLHDFVRYVSGIIENGTSIEIAPAQTEGAVSLMTVHKSKGLEFPAVILMGTQTGFNTKDSTASSVFTDYEGIGFVSKLTDPTGMAVEDTPLRLSVAALLSGMTKEEEIRILYVALTRAKEELHITAHGNDAYPQKTREKAEELFSRETPAYTAGNWADWIVSSLQGLDGQKEDGFFRITDVYPRAAESEAGEAGTSAEDGQEAKTEDLTEISVPPVIQKDEDSSAADPDFEAKKKAAYEKIRAALDYVYPYEKLSKIPAKLSVSKLYPDLITDAESEGTLTLTGDEDEDAVPSFMGGEAAGAADRGTATHLFMQFCDFSRLDGTSAAVDTELDRLVSEKFIPAKTAALVRRRELCAFTESSFFAELKKARRTERERRFSIFLPASDFTGDTALKEELKDETLLVQGVIDLVYEDKDGHLVLCDYKTDRLSPEVRTSPAAVAALMKERHGQQLSYYAKAVTQLFGRAPDRICVFPLAYGEAVDIDI